MSLDVAVNLNSLRVIREELDATIQRSSTDFEAYLADMKSVSHLESTGKEIAQVGGIFRLLEYPGAALMADEMAALVDHMLALEKTPTNGMVNALMHAFFVLPRYIEYVGTRQSALPILVIPYVNEMRAVRNLELIPEYHFYNGEITASASSVGGETAAHTDLPLLLSTASRLRHMYQVGLLGLIRDKNHGSHNFGLMSRAVHRVSRLSGGYPGAEVWELTTVVLECFEYGTLELTLNRKRMLAGIEKLFRQLVTEGEIALQVPAPDSLKRDLLFILMLSDHSSPKVEALRESYSLQVSPVMDTEVAHQRELMHGPSQDTFESVIKVLKEEMNLAKDILEIASQNCGIEEEDLEQLLDVIRRVADTLTILNLAGPRATLREQLQKISSWSERSDRIETKDFLEVADAVLFVESSLSGLDRHELSIDDLNDDTEMDRIKVIASSHLAEAQRVVIEEAQAGISLAKRAITSYVESNFDLIHISNVAVTLNTVRGGLHVLSYSRAAAVLKSSIDFIESYIKQKDSSGQQHQLLETLADALISLEYYLGEVATSRVVNEKILEVAEESLAALGFEVETVITE